MGNLDKALTRENLMNQLDSSWNELYDYLTSLTEEQLTIPGDAAGWTAKDHAIHVAMWEKASLAMLQGKSKRETLNITEEVWDQDDDPINAVIQQRYRDMPIAEVMQTLRENHANMVEKLDSMTQEDLLLPYKHYQKQSSEETPIIKFIQWDTIHHYGEHKTWIAAIIDNA